MHDLPSHCSCTNSVNPTYYVGFSTATLVASLILFQGINTTDGTKTVSLLAGFVVTFLGVHLLNISRAPEPTHSHTALEHGLMNPRLSLTGRMSLDGWNGVTGFRPDGFVGSHSRSNSRTGIHRHLAQPIFDALDEEDVLGESVGLQQLNEEPEEDEEEDLDKVDERTRLHSNTGNPPRRHTPTLSNGRAPLSRSSSTSGHRSPRGSPLAAQ